MRTSIFYRSSLVPAVFILLFFAGCSSLTQTRGLKRLGSLEVGQQAFLSVPGSGPAIFQFGYGIQLGIVKGVSLGAGAYFDLNPGAGLGCFVPLNLRITPKLTESLSLDFQYNLHLLLLSKQTIPFHSLLIGGIYTTQEGTECYLGFKGVYDYWLNPRAFSGGISTAFEAFLIPNKRWLSISGQIDFLVPLYSEENKNNYGFTFIFSRVQSLNFYLGFGLGLNFYLDFLKPLSSQIL